MFRLLAFVLPLGVDSFAVAAVLGAAGPTGTRERLRVSLIFVVFEAGMPLVGLAAGAGIARATGSVADYLAGAAVIVLGIYMVVARDDGGEQKAGRLASTHRLAILALGISISLDEFAIGFSLGLLRLPAAPVIIAIAIQALLGPRRGQIRARAAARDDVLGGPIGSDYAWQKQGRSRPELPMHRHAAWTPACSAVAGTANGLRALDNRTPTRRSARFSAALRRTHECAEWGDLRTRPHG